MGFSKEDWQGKPVIAVINSWSDINQCHAHFKSRVEDVKRGIFQAGGFPIELPTLSLSEPFVKPTTMLYRNMMAMEVEELIRSHPIDASVLMGGCDKTTPAMLIAVSAGLPCIFSLQDQCSEEIGGKTLGSDQTHGNIGMKEELEI